MAIPLGAFPPGSNIPTPTPSSSPLEYAEALGEAYLTFSKRNQRKKGGHYLTPIAIARFMAGHGLYSEPRMQVLDPGSGTGILSAAVCEEVSRSGTVRALHIDADFQQFKRHVENIAWETEVWIAEIPDHLIHFNGDKFLGPREG